MIAVHLIGAGLIVATAILWGIAVFTGLLLSAMAVSYLGLDKNLYHSRRPANIREVNDHFIFLSMIAVAVFVLSVIWNLSVNGVTSSRDFSTVIYELSIGYGFIYSLILFCCCSLGIIPALWVCDSDASYEIKFKLVVAIVCAILLDVLLPYYYQIWPSPSFEYFMEVRK